MFDLTNPGEITPEGRARLDKYGSTLDAENVRLLCERIADYPEVIAAVDALRNTVTPPADHDHDKCCRYLLCAHPTCCGYNGEVAR